MNGYKARLKQIERMTADNSMNDLFAAFGVKNVTCTRRQWETNLSRIEQLPTADILSGAGMEAAPL